MPPRLTSDEITIRNLCTINRAFDKRIAAKDKRVEALQLERADIERERQDELDAWLSGYKAEKADALLLAAGMRVDAGIEDVAAADTVPPERE
jgi:hypothetical protein